MTANVSRLKFYNILQIFIGSILRIIENCFEKGGKYRILGPYQKSHICLDMGSLWKYHKKARKIEKIDYNSANDAGESGDSEKPRFW